MLDKKKIKQSKPINTLSVKLQWFFMDYEYFGNKIKM